MLTYEAFSEWLTRYGRAWEQRSGADAKRLFTADALYYWTPFEAPQRGPDEIAAAWNAATSRQRDIEFEFRIWYISGSEGAARWHTRLTRIATGVPVEIDGVLFAEFDPSGACRLFREWWHSNEVR